MIVEPVQYTVPKLVDISILKIKDTVVKNKKGTAPVFLKKYLRIRTLTI